MKITLHIGLEKTGTSTIQGFLRASRDRLLDEGVLFPASPGKLNHTMIAAACMSEDVNIRARAIRSHGVNFADALRADLKQEIVASKADRLLLSNEHCSSRLRTKAELTRLRDLVGELGELTRVIVYLRRQDDFLLSTYSTAVKSGSGKAFTIPVGRRGLERYDYQRMLEDWGAVFGLQRLYPRRFEQSSWVNGDLLQDFCDVSQIGTSGSGIPVRNTSLSAEGLSYLRRRNTESGGVRDGRVVRVISDLTKGPKLSLGTAGRRAFLAKFDEGNGWVARTFFKDDTLFQPVAEEITEHGLPELSAERMNFLNEAVATAAESRQKAKRAKKPPGRGRMAGGHKNGPPR